MRELQYNRRKEDDLIANRVSHLTRMKRQKNNRRCFYE